MMRQRLRDLRLCSCRETVRPLTSILKTRTRNPHSASGAETESMAFQSWLVYRPPDRPEIQGPAVARLCRKPHPQNRRVSSRVVECQSDSPCAREMYVHLKQAKRSQAAQHVA